MYSNIPAVVDILSPFTYANTLTNNWFGGFLILTIFGITFMSLKLYNTEKAFLTASLVAFISSVLLLPTGISNPLITTITIPMILFGFFINH